MKRFLLLLVLFLLTGQLLADEIWTEKAQNPSWWPYRHYDPKRPSIREDMHDWYADLDPPCPTNRVVDALYGSTWRKAVLVSTNIQLVATDDPFKEVPGYWPTFYGAAAYLDGKYMIAAGQMCNYALRKDETKLTFPGMDNYCKFVRDGTKSGDLLDYGYFWPSNSYAYASEQFSFNRSVQFHIYDVASDTWDSSKYDGSGPPTYVNMEAGKCAARWIDDNEDSWQVQEAVMRDGVRCGGNQAFLYDFDESGTPSFFLHGGYPSWDGTFSIYNPTKKPKQDPESSYGAWSGSSGAIAEGAFSGSYHCHYGGGAVCIDGIAYVLGGGYWGQSAGLCMQTYNTKTDQWRAYENIYSDNLSDFGIATWGSKIYLLGDSSISSKIRVMETATNKFQFVDSDLELQIPVSCPAVVGYNGVIYAIGGRSRVQVINDGVTNTVVKPIDDFQIVNTVLRSAVVHSTKLPIAAYYAACAVTEDGKLLFGGSMLSRDPVTGKDVAGSRLWIGEMPTQDLYVSPSTLNYGQTEETMEVEFYNVSNKELDVHVTASEEWLTIDDHVTIPPNSKAKYAVTINREKVQGPVSGQLGLAWGEESMTLNVSADTPRPIPVFSATKAITLKPTTKEFWVANVGTVNLNYTFTSDTEGAEITPAAGAIAPGATNIFYYTIGEGCPRPGTVVYTMEYNSYDGSKETFTVSNYANTYYVSPEGNDDNDGTSPETAWKTLAYAFEAVPNGSAEEGYITLSVATAVYAGDSQQPTDWTLDLSKKSYLWVKGETTDKPIYVTGYFIDQIDRPLLTPGDKKWHKGTGGDVWDDVPAVKMENVDHVRFSNFILDGSYPDTNIVTVGVGASLPNMTELIGINNANGVQIDNNYFYGMFDGECFDVTTNQVTNWEHFYYIGLTYHGNIGPDDITINNNLFEGFTRGIYHNGYPARDDSSNTNFAYITANTFTKQHSNGGVCVAISSNFQDTWYGAAQVCTSNIFAEIPDQDYEYEPMWTCAYNTGDAVIILGHDDFAVLSQYNQYYDIGGPGGADYYTSGVTYELDDIYYQIDFTDYTNEVPNFIAYTWFKTDPETQYGDRYVGWAFIPEPLCGLALIALALFALHRK
ncbi:hypothetical protein J6U76_09110 [bacterium]|nr:hypothetical protein [bacterium]